MTQFARLRLNVEHLETRDLPSSLTQSIDTTNQPTLPGGWTQWSSDGSTVFSSIAGQGAGAVGEVVSTGGSNTSGLAWETQSVAGDTSASAEVDLTSLVPTFVFARGANLGTAAPSYIAAEVTRGATVTVVQVTNGVSTTLASLTSHPSSYFSGNWAEVTLIPNGSSVSVQIVREDTNQYLNAQGNWQSTATNALSVTTTLADADGEVGIGRAASYSGAVDWNDFTLNLSPTPPPTVAAVSQSFDSTALIAMPSGWQSWSNNSSGSAGVSSTVALSPPNSYALTGNSNSTVLAWTTSSLPAAVTAGVNVDVNSLIPAQIFVNGANLNSSTPTYDAVTVTRGLQASLVQVIDGTTTTLSTIATSPSQYLSGEWVQVELTAQGTNLLATIYRTDTNQWLGSNGVWSSTPSDAFDVQNAVSLAAGKAGIGRQANYSGTTYFDNFMAGASGSIGPVVTLTSDAGRNATTSSITFQSSAKGNISELVFLLNGQAQSTSTSATASWTLNTAVLPSGNYTVTVLAGASNGLVGVGTYPLTVDNPTVPPPPASPPVVVSPPIAINANPTTSVSYAAVPSSDTLFGPDGPSYLDVEQGQLGDCWLLASLAEVAAQDPQAITQMFKYDGTTVDNGVTVGVYTVRFFNSNDVAKSVTINTELPEGGNWYDHPLNGVLWVALAEKAYAVANGLGYVSSSDPGSSTYNNLESGYPTWALQAITGNSGSNSFVSTSQIVSAWDAGNFVVLPTVTPISSELVPNHDYAVVGYNASTGLFTLLNPWGGATNSDLCPQDTQVYGLFTASASFVSANFSGQTIAARSSAPTSGFESVVGPFGAAPAAGAKLTGDSELPGLSPYVQNSRSPQASRVPDVSIEELQPKHHAQKALSDQQCSTFDGDDEFSSSSGIFVD